MERQYSSIIDLRNTRVKKLENSSYLEDLTGLIEKAASKIDSGDYYRFSNSFYLAGHPSEPNSSFGGFIQAFKNSFDNSSSDKIHIIRGRAGIGKTLFFSKGIQILLRKKDEHKERYIPLSVDFRNIDENQTIQNYTDLIYSKLRANAIDAIRQLSSDINTEFINEYKEFIGPEFETRYEMLFPVMFFCKQIFYKYGKPCIIVFDNIDLSSVETQKRVFKATANVFAKLCEIVNALGEKDSFRVYFAMRPETYLHSNEARLGEVINFPLPNIQAICLDVIKGILEDTAKSFDKNGQLKCEVEYYSVIDNKRIVAKTFLDVADYFNRIFTYFFNNLWTSEVVERLGKNEDFHCDLVNYNVRTFLSFLSDTLSNGGFKPLTKEFNTRQVNYYTVYDYVEMVIRGRWVIHPGNIHIDGEGGNKAPIVFNVFDNWLWKNTQKMKIKHFMLNIRILQRFCLLGNDEPIRYGQLKDELSEFFDEDHIMRAIQELIFVRIIYSFSEGDENIASKSEWREVTIDESTQLYLSPTGKFYLEKMVCEFEYLYQMAPTSLLPKEYVEELRDRWKNEKELTVLRFLMGIYAILKENIASYEKNHTLSFFITLFCQDDEIHCKPFRRMIDRFIYVIQNKIQRAEKQESSRVTDLYSILQDAQALKDEASKFFSEKLGD